MIEVLNFLAERSRGFILTLTGAGVGSFPEIVGETNFSELSMEPLQKLVLILTGIVAILTIISYGYKFYKWTIEKCKKRK